MQHMEGPVSSGMHATIPACSSYFVLIKWTVLKPGEWHNANCANALASVFACHSDTTVRVSVWCTSRLACLPVCLSALFVCLLVL